MRRREGPPAGGWAFSRAASAIRAAVAATAWRAMASSRPRARTGPGGPPPAAGCAAPSPRRAPRPRGRGRAPAPRPVGPESAGGRRRTSENSRSICGVSQTAAARAAISAWLRGAAPLRRNTRRSGGPSGGVPVPMSVGSSLPWVWKRPATAQSAGAAVAREVGDAGAAQAAAGHQERNSLQQVGLAAAVGSGQHADTRGGPPCQRRVVAKIGQGQAEQAHPAISGGAGGVRQRAGGWGATAVTRLPLRGVGGRTKPRAAAV